ncbi:MAG: recombinase family protein [Clostridia bacterium]
MMKVATYCRVSTSSEDQINSFERQMQMYNEEITLHDDWELYNSYYDKGLSGTEVLNRPGFLEMKEAGLNREYDILITREVSRLSRNIQHFYEFVRPLVKKGIQIFFLDDEVDSNMPDFETRVASLISHAQDESRKTSQRVKRGQKIAMQSGSVFGNSLLGYDLRDTKLYINRKGAEIVRKIFDMYVNRDMGIRQIKKALERENIKTMKNNINWSIKSIYSILRNEKYCGDLVQQKTYTPDYLTHEKKKNPGRTITIKNHHEPIISRAMWNKAQEKLNRKSPDTADCISNRYVMSGKIKCSECGKSFVSRTRKNRDGSLTKVWRCSTANTDGAKKANGIGCNNGKQVRDDVALDMLYQSLGTLKFDNEYIIQNLLHIIRKTLKGAINHDHKNLACYENELKKLTEKQSRILDMDLSGDYPKDIIAKKLSYINSDIADVNQKIDVLKKSDDAARNYDEFEKDIAEYIKNLLCFNHASKEYLRAILKKITVYPDRTAKLELENINKVWEFTL